VGLPGWATRSGLRMCLATPAGVGASYYHPRADGTDAFAWATQEFLPMVERRLGAVGISGGCHDVGFWRRNATARLRFIAGHLD
jgi:hypothetical protein